MDSLKGSERGLLIACSGGPDSVALLDVADRWRGMTGAFVAVGHVDHGLRGRSSRADAAFVRAECVRRGIPVGIARVSVQAWARKRRRGLEDAARELRYRALAHLARRFGCAVVATAHTLDDQVETVFLHLLRGAGPAGLAGMAEASAWPFPLTGKSLRLIRPFLNVPKKEIFRYLRARRLSFRVDASNALPLFLRNRLRPVLRSWETLRPGFSHRVAQTARLLRDEEDFWRTRLALRRKSLPIRLERAPFLRYHVAEQRRRLRHLYGLSRFDVVERVRSFVADRSQGPLDIPGGRVSKTKRFLFFHHPEKADS
ncbi:MAG: tRNA lysidine(34) synthetase TilS [Elusimicrobia bacterium]|nr:tRNA lysidine(34) synthetase TilS [Elusimicrobiota bacterium]